MRPEFEKDSWAFVSPCSQYRYWLHRRWNSGHGWLVWIMLNPSTADAMIDDATIRRCINFAKAMGYAGIVVVNLCAYRATDPRALMSKRDPEGPENRQWLVAAINVPFFYGGRIVAGWGGNTIAKSRRMRERKQWLREISNDVYCLGFTQDGDPRHPLYMPIGTELQRYKWEDARG